MKVVNYVLWPLSLLYGLGVSLRNLLYDKGILRSHSFKTPVILIGNLTVGGTGKTPHVEAVTELLDDEGIASAVLSRGYGRKSKGYREANAESTFLEIGDEPLQIARKFKQVPVAVDANRTRGILKLVQNHPKLKAIVMDDGFQHRKIRPGLSILLRDYALIDEPNFLLPAGTLREWKSGAERADIIIVTKTPAFFSPLEKRIVKEKVKKLDDQEVFFTYIDYGELVSVNTMEPMPFCNKQYYIERGFSVLLVTGIAKSAPLVEYLRSRFKKVEHVEFGDHHRYSPADIEKIKLAYDKMPGQHKIVITTEKDAMRLCLPELKGLYENIPLFYIGVKVRFHHDDYHYFKKLILDYVKPNHASNRIPSIQNYS